MPEQEYAAEGNSNLLIVLAASSFSHAQDRAELPSGDPNLVPQDFTVDDVPISIKMPFTLFVNGQEWQGHTIGWHISAVSHPNHAGSTMWLGLPGRGMYILSLGPREGYSFQKAGAIRNNVIGCVAKSSVSESDILQHIP